MRRPLNVVLLTVSILGTGAVPASAASQTQIASVYETSGSPRAVSSGAVVRNIRVNVSSQSATGLSYLRLEALGGGDDQWSCIHRWAASGAHSFNGSVDWKTSNWPSPGPFTGCTEDTPHRHGEPTVNTSYTLRVVAFDGSGQDVSSGFVVKLNNPAAPPAWRGEPSVDGPRVTLRWYRAAETDVAEYQISRVNAARRTTTIAVSTSHPTETPGCAAEVEATFTCTDTVATGGRTQYSVKALRPSPSESTRCRTSAQRCIASAASAKKMVTIAGVSSTPPRTASSPGPVSATRSPTDASFEASPPAASPSFHRNAAPLAAPPSREPSSRTAPITAAAVAVALLALAHVRRRMASRS